MDTKILEEIGLTPGEIKVYLSLLKKKVSSVGPISRDANVSRSKIYDILDRLEKKGLVSHIEKNNITYFKSEQPQRIKQYLEQEEANLKRLKENLEEFLPKLESIQNEKEEDKNVSVYVGYKGIISAHEHVYSKLKKGEEVLVLGIPKFQPEEYINFWKSDQIRRKNAGIKYRLLFNKDADSKDVKDRNKLKGSEARFMPIDVNSPASFTVYKDTVLIILQSPSALAIEIINKYIADSFKTYFEAFWKKAKKVN